MLKKAKANSLPKPCILVSSCLRDQQNGSNDSIRQTWAKDSPIPVFFVVGDGVFARQSDEVKLNVPDHYLAMPLKAKASLAWAVRNGFTHVFRCFTDSYVDVFRLADSRFQNHDYIGNFVDGFAQGGPGYWLGPKAISIVLDCPIRPEKFEADKYEDQWIGRVLCGVGMDDKRYSMGMSLKKAEPDPLHENDVVSVHLSMWTNQYDRDWMHQVHARRHKLPFLASVPRLPHQCLCQHCRSLRAQ